MPISPAFPPPTPMLLSNQDRPPACPFFMPTIKQIAANRLNALRSSGPRSVAGKAVSSMNALGSGIDAKSNLIRGEDSAALETLTREYRERFLPATPEERLLVDILIHDEWLLRRFRRIDAEILECEMQDAWTPKNDCAPARPSPAAKTPSAASSAASIPPSAPTTAHSKPSASSGRTPTLRLLQPTWTHLPSPLHPRPRT